MVDEGRAVGGVYLNFGKASDSVSASHNTLLDKLIKYCLDKPTVRSENWLNSQAQRVRPMGQSPVGGKSLVEYSRH